MVIVTDMNEGFVSGVIFERTRTFFELNCALSGNHDYMMVCVQTTTLWFLEKHLTTIPKVCACKCHDV